MSDEPADEVESEVAAPSAALVPVSEPAPLPALKGAQRYKATLVCPLTGQLFDEVRMSDTLASPAWMAMMGSWWQQTQRAHGPPWPVRRQSSLLAAARRTPISRSSVSC